MECVAFGTRPAGRPCCPAPGRHSPHLALTQRIDCLRHRTPAGEAAVFHSPLCRPFFDCHLCHAVARSIQPLSRTHRSLSCPLSLSCPAVDRGHYCGPAFPQASPCRRYGDGRVAFLDLGLTSSFIVRALHEMAPKGRVAYHEWRAAGVPSLLLSRLLSSGGCCRRLAQRQGEPPRHRCRHRSAVCLSADRTQIRPSTV